MKGDDVYHFIAYVPVGGAVYELDGLKEGPIFLGACNEATWTDVAKPVIRARMERYAKSETGFNLLALIENQELVLQRKMGHLRASRTSIMNVLSGNMDLASAELRSLSPLDLQKQLNALEHEEVNVSRDISTEKARLESWRQENLRRRHDYSPFIFTLLDVLAKKGRLEGLIEQARKKP